jgi:hypothetical protein
LGLPVTVKNGQRRLIPRRKPPLAGALLARGKKHQATLDVELTGARGLEQSTVTSSLDGGASTFRWARTPARGPVAAPSPSSESHGQPPLLGVWRAEG